jgi:hypothetical protein
MRCIRDPWHSSHVRGCPVQVLAACDIEEGLIHGVDLQLRGHDQQRLHDSRRDRRIDLRLGQALDEVRTVLPRFPNPRRSLTCPSNINHLAHPSPRNMSQKVASVLRDYQPGFT